MAYRKTGTRTRKRNYRKRKTFGKKVSPLKKYILGMPPYMNRCLKYAENVSMGNQVIGQNQTITWIPNDLYDPYYTGTGHQSLFRDQLYDLYFYGRCLAYKIECDIICTNATAPVDIALLRTGDVANVPTSMSQVIEQPNVKFVRINGSSGRAKLSLFTYVDRNLGNRKGTALYDDRFKQGPNSGLPSIAGCVNQVITASSDGSSYTVQVFVRIWQYARFEDLRTIAQS